MISDVLSEAVSAIEEYQKELPESYSGRIKGPIEKVIIVMSALQDLLYCGGIVPSDKLEPLFAALEELDVSRVRQALDAERPAAPLPHDRA